ncbi:hypothetical protein NXU96_22490 [Phocaeicola vulgatus]|nr:hypothetical protein [Phocaeicola vulgatus]
MMDKYEDYFDPKGQLFVSYSAAGAKKSYYPVYLPESRNGKRFVDIYLSGCPDVTPGSDTQQYGLHGLYFSAAETNFFLAEFTPWLGAT